MRGRIIPVLCLLFLSAFPVHGKGFFEVLYATEATQTEDLDGFLKDAPSTGVAFGYDTEIASSGVFIDVELGYEVGTHEFEGFDSDYYFRNHRGFVGLRIKYGGFGYVEPYIGGGVMAYAYYEASSTASKDAVNFPPIGMPDFEIEKNLSGSYVVYGVDFFFSKEGNFSIGVEQRTMTFGLKNVDDPSITFDAEVSRLAFKISILF